MKAKSKKRSIQEDDEEEEEEDWDFKENERDEEDSGEEEDDDGNMEAVDSDGEAGEEAREEASDGGDEDEEDAVEGDRLRSSNLRNPSASWSTIQKKLGILRNFGERREGSKSRVEYMSELAADLSEYYGYLVELVELLLRVFGPAECVEYMEASEAPRPVVLRTNTLKTRRKDLLGTLQKRGMRCEPLAAWSKVGIKVSSSEVPVGATPEYLAGHYTLQSAASLCPVMALDPQPGERILDVSAAPGGKTSYIAQLLKNEGSIIANDLKKVRHKATVANLHRLGVTNCVTCVGDGRQLPTVVKGFDRVLLDAPCTGLGIISRDPSVKGQRTLRDVSRLSQIQKQLIVAAIDTLDCKKAAVLVYSTCSISVEENEAVVQFALDHRHCKLVSAVGLDHGKPAFARYHEKRFHPSMTLARRFYPHVHNMDGFFVARLVKTLPGPKKSAPLYANPLAPDDIDQGRRADGTAADPPLNNRKPKEKKESTNRKAARNNTNVSHGNHRGRSRENPPTLKSKRRKKK